MTLFVGVPLATTDNELSAIMRAGVEALAAEGFATSAFCTESCFLSGGGVIFFDADLRLAAAFFAAGFLLMAAFFRTVFFLAAAFLTGFFFDASGLRTACFFARGFFFTILLVVFLFLEGALLGLTRDLADLDGRLAALLFLERFFMGCWVGVEN